MKIKRTGPAVDVPALGLVDVKPGDEVEVSDEAAVGFDGQSGWEPVSEKQVPAAKRAASEKGEK